MTTAILTISTVFQTWVLSCTAKMFQIPVATSTTKAGHATWLKRRATLRGTSAPAALQRGYERARG